MTDKIKFKVIFKVWLSTNIEEVRTYFIYAYSKVDCIIILKNYINDNLEVLEMSEVIEMDE